MVSNKTPLPSEILQHCRELRKNATNPEKVLWALLRNRQLKNAKFRRQHPIEGYIVDFYCQESQLAIELDGSNHLDDSHTIYDEERTELLNSRGIRVIRFWNNDVLQDTETVLYVIWDALGSLMTALDREMKDDPPL